MTVVQDKPRDAALSSASSSGGRAWAFAGVAALLAGGAAGLAWALVAWLGSAWAPIAAAAAALLAAVVPAVLSARLLRLGSSGVTAARRLDGPDPSVNRNHFLSLAEREWSRARRYGSEPALLLVEVDRFARMTEARGPQAGDLVLRALVRELAPALRGADAMARFGGAQLAVWLAQVDPIGALDVADRIRERAEALEIAMPTGATPLRVTVSVGVSVLRPTHLNLGALLVDAESAVQAARQAGGNCVRAAPVDPARLRKEAPPRSAFGTPPQAGDASGPTA